ARKLFLSKLFSKSKNQPNAGSHFLKMKSGWQLRQRSCFPEAKRTNETARHQLLFDQLCAIHPFQQLLFLFSFLFFLQVGADLKDFPVWFLPKNYQIPIYFFQWFGFRRKKIVGLLIKLYF